MPSRRRVLGGSAGLLALLAGCTAGEDPPGTNTHTTTTTEPPDTPTTTPPGNGSASKSGPWPTFRGDAANTGVAAGGGPTGEPSVLWRTPNLPRAEAVPVATTDGVYAPSNDGTLYALSRDGDERWRANIEERPWTPAVVGDRVVVPTGEALVAFDRDGEVAWRLPGRGFFQQPGALDGTVVAGSFHSGAVLVDAEDGSEVGRVAEEWRAFEPVVADGVAYVALSNNRNDGGAVAAIAADGEEAWRADLDERATSRVGFADGTVYAGTDSGYVYALDAATGDRRWRTSVGEWVTRGPTAADGRLFAATLHEGVVALDADGEEAWRVDLDASTDPVVVGDRVITDDGREAVVALDAADGAERWRLETDGSVREGVRVAGDRGVVGTATGTVHAFDPATGEERWRHVTKPRRFPSPVVGSRFAYVGSRGTGTSGYVLEKGAPKWNVEHPGWAPNAPAVVGSTVVSASEGGDVNATKAYTYPDVPAGLTPTPTGDDGTTVHVDPPREEEVWNTALDAGVRSSVSYADGTAVVGTDDGLAAVDVASGEVAWRASRGGAVESTPAVVTEGTTDADGAVVAGANDGTVAAHALADGSERWTVETGDAVVSSPAVRDGTAYVGSDDGSLHALAVADGTEAWRFDTGGPVVSSPAATSETVVVGSADGGVYAVDAATGEQRWRFDTGGPVYSSPAVGRGDDGDTVYVGSRDRYLYALVLADGSERWRFETDNWVDSSPALGYGAVFVADQSGYLYALVD